MAIFQLKIVGPSPETGFMGMLQKRNTPMRLKAPIECYHTSLRNAELVGDYASLLCFLFQTDTPDGGHYLDRESRHE